MNRKAREAAIGRAGGACEGCGSVLAPDSFHVHHITYERRGREAPEDLRVLCLSCHEREHPGQHFSMSYESIGYRAASFIRACEKRRANPTAELEYALCRWDEKLPPGRLASEVRDRHNRSLAPFVPLSEHQIAEDES